MKIGKTTENRFLNAMSDSSPIFIGSLLNERRSREYNISASFRKWKPLVMAHQVLALEGQADSESLGQDLEITPNQINTTLKISKINVL